MVLPAAFWLVFHCSLMMCGLPAIVRGTTAWTNAALGENVPAAPPLSFQATTTPSTLIATSWLMPALAVHRSTLAVITAVESTPGETDSFSPVVSMSVHVVPLLLGRAYCFVVMAL